MPPPSAEGGYVRCTFSSSHLEKPLDFENFTATHVGLSQRGSFRGGSSAVGGEGVPLSNSKLLFPDKSQFITVCNNIDNL